MSLNAQFTFGLRYQDTEDGPNILFPMPAVSLTYENVNPTSETVEDGEGSGYSMSLNTDNICVVQGLAVVSEGLTGEINVSLSGADPFSLQPDTGFALPLPNESPDQPIYYVDLETVANQDGNDGRVRTIAFGVPW